MSVRLPGQEMHREFRCPSLSGASSAHCVLGEFSGRACPPGGGLRSPAGPTRVAGGANGLSCVQSLCSAVVQVYGCERACGWVKRCCGVACLVKDNPQRSYYIRVLDMKVRVKLAPGPGETCECSWVCLQEGRTMFEQELYHSFSISCSRSYFISFAGDVSVRTCDARGCLSRTRTCDHLMPCPPADLPAGPELCQRGRGQKVPNGHRRAAQPPTAQERYVLLRPVTGLLMWLCWSRRSGRCLPQANLPGRTSVCSIRGAHVPSAAWISNLGRSSLFGLQGNGANVHNRHQKVQTQPASISMPTDP